MATKSYKADIKIFVEDLNISGGSIIPTGILKEIDSFNNVTWSVGSSFSKSASIQFNNPSEELSTSIRHKKGFYRGAEEVSEAYLAGYARSISELFGEHKETLNYLHQKELESEPDQELLKADFIYGVKKMPTYSYTGQDVIEYYLVPMQRVWILSRTTGLGADKTNNIKDNIWAGIITGFSESFGSDSETTLNVSCSGLFRFLELTDIFAHYRLAAYQGNLNDKFAKVLNDNLYSKFHTTELLGQLKPTAFLTLPTFMANFFYTQSGNDLNYDLEAIELGRSEDFFLHEPIWLLNTDENNCWQQLVEGDSSMAFGKSKPYSDNGIDTITNLWSGEKVFTWQMLPSVYIDPLIIALFEDESDVAIIKQQFQKTFDLADNNTINAKDMIVKAAQAIMASAYEDDFGNIIMEIPPYWSAPNKNGNFVCDKKYDSSYYSLYLVDPTHDLNYVLSDMDLFRVTKSFDESNIVTYTETPANYQWDVNLGEVVDRINMTGRVSDQDTDNIELQRRFGVRLLTTPPIVTNTTTMGKKDYSQFIKALNQFAKTAQQLRNYSAWAGSIETTFLHWLKVNRNVLLMYDCALWMITDKSLSYTLEGGALSCSFTLSMRHKINERLAYPFLDLYIGDDTGA